MNYLNICQAVISSIFIYANSLLTICVCIIIFLIRIKKVNSRTSSHVDICALIFLFLFLVTIVLAHVVTVTSQKVCIMHKAMSVCKKVRMQNNSTNLNFLITLLHTFLFHPFNIIVIRNNHFIVIFVAFHSL